MGINIYIYIYIGKIVIKIKFYDLLLFGCCCSNVDIFISFIWCYCLFHEKGKKIAKFGIVTKRGPSAPVIDETIRENYNIEPPSLGAGIGAIIYMVVEPEHRGKGIGSLALEAIAAIHTVQGIDFTVLVADDNGTGKLIKWYEENGYTIAPKLQDLLGSPDAKFGTTMIRPSSVRSDIFGDCQIQWW